MNVYLEELIQSINERNEVAESLEMNTLKLRSSRDFREICVCFLIMMIVLYSGT